MTEFELRAKEMVNQIYQPLGHLRCMVSNDEMWEYSKERVRNQIELIKQQLPMYTGCLNPKWKYWEEVRKAVELIP